MADATESTQTLIEQACRGQDEAWLTLLERYRDYLRRMVAVRLDRRLAPRVDPSDVVQESLALALQRMDEYLRNQPLPFVGLLRQIAAESVRDTHRRHLSSQRRSVHREAKAGNLPDDSAAELEQRLMARDTSPSNRLMREERRMQVKTALAELPPRDRDVLVMRYLEHLSVAEMAEALGITEGAVKVRLLRALDRTRTRMEKDW
jgi:RNA polymerase sigma-70 factor, ECF subfamily